MSTDIKEEVSSEVSKLPKELDELINLVGNFIKYFGFKKVHGQIWAHLFFSTEPVDAPLLMKRLGISKALVSMTINDLLKYNVIYQEEEKSSIGTFIYKINPKIVSVITEVLKNRESVLLDEIYDKWTKVEEVIEETDYSIDRARVEQFGALVEQAQKHLCSMIKLASIDMSVWNKFSTIK